MGNELEERALAGGNTNTVVKVGETVRRNLAPQSPNIHAFLQHLEAKSLATPRFLGIDDQGREILSFIEGETELPKDLWEDEKYIVNSVRLLRALHDASADFEPPQPKNWAYAYPDSTRHEVINHGDFAPYNMVFQIDGSVSILDFDLCGPGPRSRDLAYLAYWMTPLSFGADDLLTQSENDLRSGCPRLKLICEIYGFSDPKALLPMVSEFLHHMHDESAITKMIGVEATMRLKSGGHLKHWAAEAATFDKRVSLLMAKLS